MLGKVMFLLSDFCIVYFNGKIIVDIFSNAL